MKKKKNNTVDLSKFNEHGLRMLSVLCYTEGWNYGRDDAEFDIQELLNENITRRYELYGEPEEWNCAIGYIYCGWEGGANYSPYTEDYNFADLVQEQLGADYASWEFKVYDAQGRERHVRTRIEAFLSEPSVSAKTYDNWLAGAEERRAKAEKKKAAAAKRRATKLVGRERALAKLTDAERKVLGL